MIVKFHSTIRRRAWLMPIFVILAALSVFGQEIKPPVPKVTNEAQRNEPVSFKEVDLGFLKLTIPSRLIDQKVKGIEGGAWEFAGDGMVLSVDSTRYAWRPTFEREYPSYSEEIVVVDNIRARLWSFSNETQSHFAFGANYATGENYRIGLGIYLQSNSKEIGELAKKIFLSVKFTSK